MEVRKPIFVIGAGRSGSTALHRILIQHPNAAWLSGFCSKYPNRPERNRQFMQAIDVPLIGSYLTRRFKSWEVYDFWETFCRGFATPYRDLLASDVTPYTKKSVVQVMEKMLTPKRNRLCIKITGWPRIGFLREIFPDARFVHILRDGRAVANSNIQVDFWDGWLGPSRWKFGDLTPGEMEAWKRHHESFVALAGIEWNRLMAATIKASQPLGPDTFLEIKYEDACADPVSAFRKIADFCELAWSEAFEKSVRQSALQSQNTKWQRDLTPDQQRILEDVVCDYLKVFGYI
ncbi:MAG TPA: sulfotransferase [Chthonomonadaceae bacterium]|nr:sulfotransferase [Chthonomonadaceae bacterium]